MLRSLCAHKLFSLGARRGAFVAVQRRSLAAKHNELNKPHPHNKLDTPDKSDQLKTVENPNQHNRLDTLHKPYQLKTEGKHNKIDTAATDPANPNIWTLEEKGMPDLEHLRFKREFDAAFCNVGVHSIHDHKDKIVSTFDDYEDIALAPLSTLQNELIDLDVDKMVATVQEGANTPGADKGQPLVACSRGSGGGKTRLLEEIRCSMTPKQDTVVLAITGNNEMCLKGDTKRKFTEFKDPEADFAAQMVLRFAFATYGKTTEIQKKAVAAIKELEKTTRGQVESFEFSLIRGFLAHATERVCRHKKLAPGATPTLAVLVDEAMIFHDHYRAKGEDDIFASLREAMLFKQVQKKIIGANVKPVLVMTSLGIEPVRMTPSERPVNVLLLPNQLDPQAVVDKWWLAGPARQTQMQPEDVANRRRMLLPLATVVSTLPRAASYVGNKFKSFCSSQDEQIKSQWQNSFSATMLLELWEHLLLELSEKYTVTSPLFSSSEIARAVLFQQSIKLNHPELPELLLNSLIVNTLSVTNSTKHLENPKVSMAMLMCVTDLCQGVSLKSFSNIARELLMKPNPPAGEALELFLFEWLVLRLQVLQACKGEITLGGLFGLADEEFQPDPNLTITVKCRNVVVHRQNVPISFIGDTVSKAFLDFFATPNLKDTDVLVVKCAKHEHFDLVLLAKDLRDKWRAVFVDCKASARDIGDTTPPPKLQQSDQAAQQSDQAAQPNQPKESNQAEKLENPLYGYKYNPSQWEYVKGALANACKDAAPSPLVDALNSRRFSFLFFTTQDKPITWDKTDKEMVILCREQARRFFGSAWEFYQAVHAPAVVGEELAENSARQKRAAKELAQPK